LFVCKQRTLPFQGWKIHVSSSVADSPKLFDRVVPLLIRSNCSFKISSSTDDVRNVNSGRAGRTLIGKIVTAYPDDARRAGELATELSRVWQSPRAPRILTDLRVGPGSAVYIRFGSFTPGDLVKDASGRIFSALRNSDGMLMPDERRLDGRQPPWVVPPVPNAVPPEPPFPIRRELEVCGQRYLLLAQLQSAPKGDTFLVADEELQTFVIKVAWRGVAEDTNGYDSCDRLKREALFLDFLTHKGFRSPQVHAVSDEAIVVDDIDGLPLDQMPREEIATPFRKLVSTVAELHDLGVAHRDIKLSNAVLAGSEVYLLDFELADFVGSADAPTGGTRGFAAPEGAHAPVSPACDVYSLGACLAHAALGADPATLVPGAGRLLSLLNSTGQQRIAQIVRWTMNPQPELRPSAWKLLERLTDLPDAWPQSPARFGRLDRKQVTNRQGRKIAEVAGRSSAAAMALPTDRVYWDNGNVAASGDVIASGIAGEVVGLAVVGYATNRDNFAEPIRVGSERIARADRSGPALGLFTGQAGIAFALALIGRKYSSNDFAVEAQTRFASASANIVERDLFSGAAGIVWAACLLSSVLNASWPMEMAEPAARRLIETVHEHERLLVWTLPGHSTADAYLGTAHGSAGIAMALGVWSRYTGCSRSRELACQTFIRLYEYGRTSDGRELRYQLNSSLGAFAGTWCHGSTGYLWSMMHAFGDHASLKAAIDWAFRGFERHTLVGEPGYCHGMAGQVDLWSLLQRYPRFSAIAKPRAQLAARLLEQLGFRSHQSWTWATGELGGLRPGLWTGGLGAACALALFRRGRGDVLFCPDTLTRVFQPVH
jgi:hypothetical protein